jgi:hypothetical protein
MKKLLVALALLPALAFAGYTVDQRLLVAIDHPSRFTCSRVALGATLTQCQAVPAAGLRYYITDIAFQSTTATAGTFSIQSGTGTNCAAATAAVWPVSATADRWSAPIAANPTGFVQLRTPIAVTAGHAICVIGHATNTLNIQISGYFAP